jgi:hypothetical protein
MAAKKPPKPSIWPNHSPREDLPPVEDRIAFIADLQRAFVFVRGKTVKELAKTWGLSEGTVSGYAAEAWRVVRGEIEDLENIKPNMSIAMDNALRMAHAQQNPVAMAKVVDTWGKLTGAHASIKQEITVADATPENAKAIMSRLFNAGKGQKRDDGEGNK